MYEYDQLDQAFVDQRVAEFRDQTRRYVAGQLSEDEFRPLRLCNGLYLQRHAPMLRIAIPYGLLASRQLAKLADIARRYDRGFGHFTTRQNLQLNWPNLTDVPDILAELATVQMHAIQTSGNCVRNVTADHLAGIARDEIDDPRPYCEIIRQWATLHPEFTYLPRKFKIAVTGSPQDRAASEVHDIGLHMARDAQGSIGFTVLVGGGLGRAPMIGQVIRDFLPLADLLSYLEAILRVYNRHGRRDNLNKARIKILVKTLGIERFREQVEAEWQLGRASAARLPAEEVARVRSFFRPQPYLALEDFDASAGREPAFQAWYRYNTRPHRMSGYRAVFVSLKAHGQNPGDMSSEQMEAVAALAERVSFGLIRTTHNQNLLLADVRQSELYEVWLELARHQLAMPNIGTPHGHDRLPRLGFLLARQRRHARGGEADPGALRQSRLPVRPGRYRDQDVRVHERLRASPRRPHRHPRRRQARRGVVPDHPRRLSQRLHGARRSHRSLSAEDPGGGNHRANRGGVSHSAHRGRALHRHVPPRGPCALQGERLCDAFCGGVRWSRTTGFTSAKRPPTARR